MAGADTRLQPVVHHAGARTYYLNRSQPPLMSAMIKIVYAATQNRTLLTTALPVRCMHALCMSVHRQ